MMCHIYTQKAGSQGSGPINNHTKTILTIFSLAKTRCKQPSSSHNPYISIASLHFGISCTSVCNDLSSTLLPHLHVIQHCDSPQCNERTFCFRLRRIKYFGVLYISDWL